MLSETQVRILLRLADFGAEVETAWDVPRDLSLPGLAEHLGLVRSAIHKPLKELQNSGLVDTRSTHVIGGGSRRRIVVFLTSQGREKVASISSEKKPTEAVGLAIGTMPDSIHIRGRDEIVSSIFDSLSSGAKIHLSGLPGIGKTSIARAVAGRLMEIGWKIRWSTCHTDADASAIGRMWVGDNALTDPIAIASVVSNRKTLIVLDEAQELSPRHVDSISQMLSECANNAGSILIAVRAPSPFTELVGYEEVRIEGLEIDDAVDLLPEDTDQELAKQVAGALGGHPLALRLWSSEDEMPGEGQELQDYVEQTVIRKLSEEAKCTLNELSLTPVPLDISEVSDDRGTAELDDAAILRWMSNLVEPHHLIRNVLRASIDEEKTKKIHSQIAEFWAKMEGPRARRIEAHHRLNSDKEVDSEWLLESIAIISDDDNAAAAVLMEDAISVSNNESFRFAAIDLALERGEPSIAENHLEEVSESPQSLIRQARLARLKGDTSLASELESMALEDLPLAEAVRHQMASLVRKHDDRLPGAKTTISLVEVDEIDISKFPESDRSAASLALDLLRHAVAQDNGEVEVTANTRSSLATMMGENHPRLALIDLRSLLLVDSTRAIETAKEFIANEENETARIQAIHASLEATHPEYPEWLIAEHANLNSNSLRPDIASHRRLSAQCWYWRGILEPSMRLSHWREAISRFKTAECSTAASDLLTRLTRSL